jgi:hypothetical protein
MHSFAIYSLVLIHYIFMLLNHDLSADMRELPPRAHTRQESQL